MAKNNWDISGDGGQSVVIESGSKRCELDGKKLMLYNGASSLADCELTTDIKLYGTAGYCQGGVILRADAEGNNGYVFERSYVGTGGGKSYLIWKIVNGVWTQLSYILTDFTWATWVRTRVRIDGWQISVDEWVSGEWSQIMLLEETSHQHTSGYIGLIGTSTNAIGSILYDNVDIGEKA